MSQKEFEKMAEVEANHWWYRSLHELVLRAIKDNFKDKDVRILDAGCGTGGLIKFMLNQGYKNIDGFDLSVDAVSFCKRIGLNVVIGDMINTNIVCPKKRYDVIISNDTLCFFSNPDEQKMIIERFNKVLGRNGIIILNVPAFNGFSGIHDVAVCIKKRFTKINIRKIIDTKRLEIKSLLYWPFLLSPIIFLIRTLQRLRLRMAMNVKIESDIDLPPRHLNAALLNLIRFESAFIKWTPFASSLFLVIKKNSPENENV